MVSLACPELAEGNHERKVEAPLALRQAQGEREGTRSVPQTPLDGDGTLDGTGGDGKGGRDDIPGVLDLGASAGLEGVPDDGVVGADKPCALASPRRWVRGMEPSISVKRMVTSPAVGEGSAAAACATKHLRQSCDCRSPPSYLFGWGVMRKYRLSAL